MEALSFKGQPRQLRHASRVVEHSVNRASQMIVEPLDDSRPVAMPLAAGYFSMHHGLCPHRSGPNNANHRRIGLGLIIFRPICVRRDRSNQPRCWYGAPTDLAISSSSSRRRSSWAPKVLAVHDKAVGPLPGLLSRRRGAARPALRLRAAQLAMVLSASSRAARRPSREANTNGRPQRDRGRPPCSPVPPRRSAAWRGGSAGGSGTRTEEPGRSGPRRRWQPLLLVVGMGRQRGGEERLGVRVHRAGAQLVALRRLDDLAQVHHRDAVADVGDGGQVVADEQIAHAERPLQVLRAG